MLDKLSNIENKYLQLREQSMDPEIISDQKRSIAINKEISSLQAIYDLIQAYKKADQEHKDAQEIIDTEHDHDMIEMAKEQLKESEHTLEELDHNIKIELLPKDPNDDKNIFLEIRPAAGGNEAGLFAAELLRMYLGYAAKK